MRYVVKDWDEYKLIDSGEGRKLEKLKDYIIDRPEPRAKHSKSLSDAIWKSADAIFLENDKKCGQWRFKSNLILESWISTYKDIKFKGDFTPYGHVGYFPDKQYHWDIIEDYLLKFKSINYIPLVLNLFGYTGVASLIAAKTDANVTHVDSSKKAINWAKENQTISDLASKSIRFIREDVSKFIDKEIRRAKKYDLIMLDPPTYGGGANKEIWNINKDLTKLIVNCKKILNNSNSLLILNTYSLGLSETELGNLCLNIFNDYNASISVGELAICENNKGRVIPQSQFSVVRIS